MRHFTEVLIHTWHRNQSSTGEGADGTTIYASRLGQRPRYNMWYIMQRPVFYGKRDGDNRRVSWGAGDGIFRFADPARCEYEYQYSHRKYEYHDEYIAEKDGAGTL